jgi:hypothetical protein
VAIAYGGKTSKSFFLAFVIGESLGYAKAGRFYFLLNLLDLLFF